MSDSIEDLARRYVEDVNADQHPRSIGLFPIPEYPELEAERGMWSAALDAILTTLRYLAPATLLTLFWGQQSFLFTLLKNIDNAFRAIVFSSEEQKQAVLQWLAEAGPVRVEHLDTVWRHGWVLCSVLDGYLPGACAGHPPTRLSLKHAQAIADHYLGVEPVFSRQELESNDSLSRHQEWKLATYLERVREALSKITPPVSKPASQRTSPETAQFNVDYIAKGSGLTAAQVNHKMSFKIYPTAQQALDPGEITILIRGPKDTYGMTVLPPVLGKAQKIRQKILGLQSKQTFTENALPITQGTTYLRTYGKNDMNKTYFIPKTVYTIEIEELKREDHTKIVYSVPLEGKYEISITSRGQNIVGSPFIVTASYNIIGILETENFCLENGEENDIVDVKSDKKVVLRIVDFVTEKMLLRENGVLEKISEDEAKLLMSTDIESERPPTSEMLMKDTITKEAEIKSDKFKVLAHKVLKMNRVCKAFIGIKENKKIAPSRAVRKQNIFVSSRSQKDIPDVVNSTLSDADFTLISTEKRDKYIVPESLSVSIKTEKAKPFYEELSTSPVQIESATSKSHDQAISSCTSDNLDKISEEEQSEDDNISIDRMTPLSSNNPFLTDTSEDFAVEKKLGTFVKTEYERNNFQNEETRDSSIKIVVENNDSPSPILNTNPFFETDPRNLERPKTPVLKIITGEVSNRVDSPYLDPKNELVSEEMLGNEFVNPFFVHQLQSSQHYEQPPMTDFIIGAPVSLPPMIRAPTPEPVMEALITSQRRNVDYKAKNIDKQEENTSRLVFSTPLDTKLSQSKDQTAISSTFHSLDSSLSDPFDNSNASTSSDNQFEPYRSEIVISKATRDSSPKKDIWDSAYVSIDDNNVSPDNNNNENAVLSDSLSKQKLSPIDDSYNQLLANMGPAERELWETCGDLHEIHKTQEEARPNRWEIKRPIFTPIIEESDRSLSSGIKETSLKHHEPDPVTVAFAELNDVYQEYFPNSENSSNTDLEDVGMERTTETNDNVVESASEPSDVIRHKPELEGTISEVQTNVTESVSVSQTLSDKINEQSHGYSSRNKDETQFGDKISNIVLEKKKYWDEKIRQIEAKTEESTKHLKKKRMSAKQLKHDSLSKRKGKQIVKNFLNTSNEQQAKLTKQLSVNKTEVQEPITKQVPTETSNEKLVEKWKKYWDEKLESENDYTETEPRSKSPRCPSKSPQRKKAESSSKTLEAKHGLKSKEPVKQELPEEIFKAFETSPKRFFGTSRQQILNKIDTFIGKPSTTVENSPTELIEVSPDSGLVSSRISLFHKMTNAEPLSWMQRKSQSMHNIHQRDSDKSVPIIEEPKIEQPYITSKISTDTSLTSTISTDTSFSSTPEKVSIKDKRTRMTHISFNKTFDETEPFASSNEENTNAIKQTGQKTFKELSRPTHIDKYKKSNVLRKTSISRSEMDIFSKVPVETDDGLDKHKSYDELPKINVKNFISLYENVSKPSAEQKPVKRIYRPSSVDSQNHWQSISVNSDAEKKIDSPSPSRLERRSISRTTTPEVIPRNCSRESKVSESLSIDSVDVKTDSESLDIDMTSKDFKGKDTTYVSLSDIELEIIESSPDKSKESSPENIVQPHIDYKNRFKKAKQFFQSLEELREDKKPRKLNECEILLNKSTESLENEKPRKKSKKIKKSHSMPSSELSKYWTQIQEKQKEESNESSKLVKISEKFHVEDLFTDVMEGRLSRQGSLRGIPHKKAVLEAFRSMENISDSKLSPYDLDNLPINDFTDENVGRSAQTYLREYPYLPTTDPSKYHSRLDAKASGLITLKELLQKKARRNSFPDLRMDTSFSADL